MQVSTAVNICLERGGLQNSLENKRDKKTRGLKNFMMERGLRNSLILAG